MFGRQDKGSGETCAACASRAEVEPAYYRCGLRPEGTDRERTGHITPCEGRWAGRGCAMNGSRQRNAGSAEVATQGGAAQRDFAWVEASVWTERMLSALGNGVKGGKWFSLMDKVFAPKTLAAAWMKVRANKGAAGVDGQSIERFAAKAEDYRPSCRRRCGGILPPASRQTGRRPQGRWKNEAAGHSNGQGSHRPAGRPARDRTDFRNTFPRRELRLPTGARCHDALRKSIG